MKDKDEFYDFKNKIKKEILNLEQKFAFSNKVLKSISKNKEEIFLNTTKKASLWMKLETEIKELKLRINELQSLFVGRKIIKIILKIILDNCFENYFGIGLKGI